MNLWRWLGSICASLDYIWILFSLRPEAEPEAEEQGKVEKSKLIMKIECLRKVLRRYPYWKFGHKELGLVSLDLNDIPSAFASGFALRELEDPDSIPAGQIIGKCYLKTGLFKEAMAEFESLLEVNNTVAIREDLASAYVGLERFDAAVNLLQKIPADKISTSARATLLFAQRKLVGF